MKDWWRVCVCCEAANTPNRINGSNFKWAQMFNCNIEASDCLFVLGFAESCWITMGNGCVRMKIGAEGKNCLNPSGFPSALKCVVFVGLRLAVRLIPPRLKMGEGAVNPHKNIVWGMRIWVYQSICELIGFQTADLTRLDLLIYSDWPTDSRLILKECELKLVVL